MSFFSEWKEKRRLKKLERERQEAIEQEEMANFQRLSRIKELERQLQEGPARRKQLKDELIEVRDEYDTLLAEHKQEVKV